MADQSNPPQATSFRTVPRNPSPAHRSPTIPPRRAVWSFAKTRAPQGLLEGIEVGFEPGGTIHLVPRLTREPDANEALLLEMVLTQAVDDHYSRSAKK